MKNYLSIALCCSLGLLLLLLNSCSLWDNPVDPQNISQHLKAPTNLNVYPINTMTFRLWWADNCDIEEGYEIDYTINFAAWQIGVVRVGKNTDNTHFNLNTVISDTDHVFFRIRAYNDKYYSGYSNTAMARLIQVEPPSFTPVSGTYNTDQTLYLSCATGSVDIYYTVDGSTPTTSSELFQNPISLSQAMIVKAKAFRDGWRASEVSSAEYVFKAADPVFSVPGGIYEEDQTVEISCVTEGAEIRYTTDGSEPNSVSVLYTSPVQITDTVILKAKAFRSGWIESQTVTASYAYGFVLVPGGTFTMGDTRGGGSGIELPTHSVTLSSFIMGRFEVTQAEWTAIMGSNPASGYGVGNDYPVYNVSWYAILKYCNLRSINEGLTPVYTISGSTDPATWGTIPTSNNSTWNAAICNWNANGYRLPTEAEWEYAARGATNTPDYLYSGSYDIDAVAWHSGNNTPNGTKPAGTKAPNSLGLYDMSGNVWEWCWDWFGGYSSEAQINPTGPTSGSYRVLRGGGWNYVASNCTVSYRGGNYAAHTYYSIGFRCVRVSP